MRIKGDFNKLAVIRLKTFKVSLVSRTFPHARRIYVYIVGTYIIGYYIPARVYLSPAIHFILLLNNF